MIRKMTRVGVFIVIDIKLQQNKQNMLPVTTVRSIRRINWSIGRIRRSIFVPVALLVTWNTDMSLMNPKALTFE